MNLNEIRAERAKCVTEARAIHEKAKTEKRSLSAEEQQSYDRAMNRVGELRDLITREEALEAEARALAEASRTETPEGKPGAEPGSDAEKRSLAFRSYLRGGLDRLSGEERRALVVSDDSQGGVLAPEVFVNSVLKRLDDLLWIRRLATKPPRIPVGRSAGFPTIETDPADADWTPEVGSISADTTMRTGRRRLTPHKLSKLIKVSEEALNGTDGNAEAIVRDRLAYKFGLTEEKAFLTGNGVEQPLGVFTASSLGISTARDVSTDNTTTAFTADGLINAKMALKAQYRRNTAAWVMHRDAVKMAAKLKDGEGQYLWRVGMREGEPDQLLGSPVYESEHAPSTFTTGLYVAVIGDFSFYQIQDADGYGIKRLDELYAATGQVGFIGKQWTDGMPVFEDAFVRVKLA